MVSKLEILNRYYQIQLDQINDPYFKYQGRYYFLATHPLEQGIESIYLTYLKQLDILGFRVVLNCYNNMFSEGCVLYTYQLQKVNFELYLNICGQKIEDKTLSLEVIKQRWCNKIDDARKCIGQYAARIELNEYYVILSYYYQGMAENAVQVLNYILLNYKETTLPGSLQHITCNKTYSCIANPHNLIISTRTRDVLMLYKAGYISLIELQSFIKKHQLSDVELAYMFARVLYPSEFFGLVMKGNIEEIELKKQLRWCYNHLHKEVVLITQLHGLLSNYIYLPSISWLKQV